MAKKLIGWALVFGGSVFISALLVRLFFGDARTIAGQAGGDSWRDFIYDFQTLMTGIAAVVAATFTVRRMKHDDREQSRRHHETLAFAIRSETRRLDRALHPQLQDLRLVASRLVSLPFGNEKDFEVPNTGYAWFTRISPKLLPIVNDLSEILERPAITGSSEYFDGKLLVAFDRAYSSAQDVQEYVTRHINVQNVNNNDDYNDLMIYEQEDWPNSGTYRVHTAFTLRERVSVLLKEMERVAAELEEMTNRFRIP